MAVRTVRLDEDSERILEALVSEMGMPASEILKQGLLALRDRRQAGTIRAYDVYKQLNLGPGGYALTSSTETRRGVRAALRRRRHLPG